MLHVTEEREDEASTQSPTEPNVTMISTSFTDDLPLRHDAHRHAYHEE